MQALSNPSWITRHMPRLQEGVLLLALMAVATLLAYEYDLFPDASDVPTQGHIISSDEMLALAGLLCVFLLVLAWRFLVAQRQEMARRIAAENRVCELSSPDSLSRIGKPRSI